MSEREEVECQQKPKNCAVLGTKGVTTAVVGRGSAACRNAGEAKRGNFKCSEAKRGLEEFRRTEIAGFGQRGSGRMWL